MSEDNWSKQFYKALEAVGNLTEVEKLSLAAMLIAVSNIKEKSAIVKREIPPPPPPENVKARGL